MYDMQPRVEVRDRDNEADLVRTLIHVYTHALLHFDVDEDTERSKREVEAEAVAYIVGRYWGLDTSVSAFYLAAWESDDPEDVRDRLDRISTTAGEIIDTLGVDIWGSVWTVTPRALRGDFEQGQLILCCPHTTTTIGTGPLFHMDNTGSLMSATKIFEDDDEFSEGDRW